jgi:hypothetical protein
MNHHAHWYVERYPSRAVLDVYYHVLSHLPQRLDLGNAVIICDAPARFGPSFAKRWRKVIAMLEKVYASTLDGAVRWELQEKIAVLEQTKFIAKPVQKANEPVVWLCTPDGKINIPSDCATIYIATPITTSQLDDCITQLPHGAAVLCYSGGRTVRLTQQET